MALEDFKTCAEHSLGQQVHDWDELVVRHLIDVAHWFERQETAVKWMIGTVATSFAASLVALLAKAVGVAAAEVTAPILIALAVGIGIGTGLVVVLDCASHLD